MLDNNSVIISQNFDALIKIKGVFWFAGQRDLEFNLDRTYIEDLSFIHKIIPLKQGSILIINDYLEIKKECGSRKFFIKRNNKWCYIKTFDLKKLLKGLK